VDLGEQVRREAVDEGDDAGVSHRLRPEVALNGTAALV
jgi:hypothetical protein